MGGMYNVLSTEVENFKSTHGKKKSLGISNILKMGRINSITEHINITNTSTFLGVENIYFRVEISYQTSF